MLRSTVLCALLGTHAALMPTPPLRAPTRLPCRADRAHTTVAAAGSGQGIKSQADSVPLPLATGLEQALSDLLGKLLSILETQETISGRKFSRADMGQADAVVTLKGNEACWTPSLKPWGAPLVALFQDDFGAVKTMALFSAIKLADSAYGQFADIVAGTWEGMPPNIKGFIPRLLRIVAALRLLDNHYTAMATRTQLNTEELVAMFDELDANGDGKLSLAEWKVYLRQSGMSEAQQEALEMVFDELDKDRSGELTRAEWANQAEYTAFLREAYTSAKEDVDVLMLRLAQLMFLLVQREGKVLLRGKELAFLETTLSPLGVDVAEGMDYQTLAKRLDDSARGLNWADELGGGAKDFNAYFILRNSNKRDLSAFEASVYGQAVQKKMDSVLSNKGKVGKEGLVLAELQALQALPF
jgi:hypothetical protein